MCLSHYWPLCLDPLEEKGKNQTDIIPAIARVLQVIRPEYQSRLAAVMLKSSPSHPYYPLDADIADYAPNETPVLELLLFAGGAVFVLLAVAFAITSYVRPTLPMENRIAILWFVLCTAPHPPSRTD